MTGKDMILMSVEEEKRLQIIRKAIEKKIKQQKAAEVLGLTERQVRRMVRRVRKEGAAGITHRLRGRKSLKKISKEITDKVIDIYAEKYKGFGPTLAHEKFVEINRVTVSRESIRQILLNAGLWETSRKGRKHRQWRERKRYCGEMVQMDGSHHDWLEGRGPRMVMMGYIDDADGNVYAEFHEYEGTIPAMKSFKGYIKKRGIPQSVYLDRHSTYKSTAKETVERQLSGENPKSQFERALGELGVVVIHANSPQAKGRIERLFRTFQDRLVKEMRLKNIRTKEEANKFLREYLPKHNRKFGVVPAGKEDLHRPAGRWGKLNRIFTIHTERTVRNDYTILFENQLYQLDTPLSLKHREVEVVELLNGKMRVEYKNQSIRYKKINPRPKMLLPIETVKTLKIRRIYRPSRLHPFKIGYKEQAVLSK